MEHENVKEKNKVVILLAHPCFSESQANKNLLEAVYNPADMELCNFVRGKGIYCGRLGKDLVKSLIYRLSVSFLLDVGTG